MKTKTKLVEAIRASLSGTAASNLRTVQCASLVATTVLASAGALAQGAGDEVLEEVVVTGTTIRGVAPTGSAVVALSKEDLLEVPVRDASAIIAKLPQGSNLGYSEALGGGNFGSSAVNLRGLGPNATLLLVDGHRLIPQGIQNVFNDPNQIPFAAIERVEVVMDGASAVYGSDAVAGVVNYILRTDYDGLNLNARYEYNDKYTGYTIDALFGHQWDGVNLMLALSYEDRGGFLQGERPYMRQDLRPLGGNDNRLVGAILSPASPGFILVGGQYYGIPKNNTGIPTAASVLPLRGQPNLVDASDYSSFLPERDRTTVYAKLGFDFTDWLNVTYSGLFSKRDSFSWAWRPLSITVPSTSPLYIPGLSATNAPLTVWYNAADNGLPRYRKAFDDTFNNYIDLTADLPNNWRLVSSLTFGSSEGCGNCGPENNQFVPFQYATTEPGLLNPYISGYQPGIQRMFGYTYHMADARLTTLNVRADGPLFSLPAGEVKISFGGEFSKSKHHLKLDQNVRDYAATMMVIRDTTKHRDVTSAFVEAFVPVLDSLDLSVATRMDDYSDFGETTNPRIGLTWQPLRDLRINGTWGTAFRAPTLIEINPGVQYGATVQSFTNNSGDPSIPITNTANGTSYVFQRTGNTETLKPEKADMYSFGFEFAPLWLEGLNLGVQYYHVDYQDRIENVPAPTTALASPANRANYAPYITPAAQPSTCVPGNISTYNPVYTAVLNNPNRLASADVSLECQAVALIEAGRQNTGQIIQSGIDIDVSYRFDTTMGTWEVGAAVAEILQLDQALLPTQEPVDVLDTIYHQVSTRGNMNVSWSRGNWNANVTGNYIGSYKNNNPITVNGVRQPVSTVPSWTTLDATVAYSVPEDDASWLRGLRVSLGARNLTDKDVPIVLTTDPTGTPTGFDVTVHDPVGRVIQFEIGKAF